MVKKRRKHKKIKKTGSGLQHVTARAFFRLCLALSFPHHFTSLLSFNSFFIHCFHLAKKKWIDLFIDRFPWLVL